MSIKVPTVSGFIPIHNILILCVDLPKMCSTAIAKPVNGYQSSVRQKFEIKTKSDLAPRWIRQNGQLCLTQSNQPIKLWNFHFLWETSSPWWIWYMPPRWAFYAVYPHCFTLLNSFNSSSRVGLFVVLQQFSPELQSECEPLWTWLKFSLKSWLPLELNARFSLRFSQEYNLVDPFRWVQTCLIQCIFCAHWAVSYS